MCQISLHQCLAALLHMWLLSQCVRARIPSLFTHVNVAAVESTPGDYAASDPEHEHAENQSKLYPLLARPEHAHHHKF